MKPSIHDLAADLHEGKLTPEELDKLRDRLATDNDAVDEFVLESFLLDQIGEQLSDIQLREHTIARVVGNLEDTADSARDTPSTAPSIRTSSSSHHIRGLSMASRHLAVGITIAVTFVATSLSVMHQIILPVRVATEEGDEKEEREPRNLESIARLVGDVEAQWEGHVENPVYGRKQKIKTGMKLYPGQKLKLASGLAEFKFFNGAEVVLEGPAEFEVQGRKQCRLTFGSLVAKAHEERSKGFIVDTPTAHVEDLGTEFAVSVDARGICDVHVFSGKVRTTAYATTGQTDTKHILVANQSIRVSDDGRVASRGVAQRNRFAARLPRPDDLHIPEEYVAAVKSAGPVVYWRFEELTAGIRNEMADAYHGRKVGRVSHLDGSATNHTLDFGPVAPGGPDRQVVCDEPLAELAKGDYSVEFWMHVDGANRSAPVSFVCYDEEDEYVGVAMLVELKPLSTNDTDTMHELRFLHRSPPGVGGGQSVYLPRIKAVGDWVHIVILKEGDSCRLYVNGKRQGAVQGVASLPASCRLVLGRLISPGMGQERYFVGQLDELAVYDRALSQQEIEHHFRILVKEKPE